MTKCMDCGPDVKKVKDEILLLVRALEKEQDSSYLKGYVSGLKEAIRILERFAVTQLRIGEG